MVRIVLVLGAACFLLFTGCSPESDKLVPRPDPSRPVEKVKDDVEDVRVYFSPTVDILFVVDDSGSMYTHQRNLSQNVSLFVGGIGANQILDYHIGVTTTSMTGWGNPNIKGRLVGDTRYVTRATPNGLAILEANLMVGTNGSGTEMMFAPTIAALTDPNLTGHNAGFYREDAHIALVFITDAEDQSDEERPSVHAADLMQFLLNLKKGDTRRILTYSVYVPSGVRNCDRDENTAPVRLESFLKMSGGVSFSLCDPDFGQKLAGLADDLVSRINKSVPLSRSPVVSTIEVSYGTQIIPNDSRIGWTFDPEQNALNFGPDLELDANQPPGSRIEITFEAARFPHEPK